MKIIRYKILSHIIILALLITAIRFGYSAACNDWKDDGTCDPNAVIAGCSANTSYPCALWPFNGPLSAVCNTATYTSTAAGDNFECFAVNDPTKKCKMVLEPCEYWGSGTCTTNMAGSCTIGIFGNGGTANVFECDKVMTSGPHPLGNRSDWVPE